MPLNMIPRRTAGKIAPAKTGKKQKARQSLGMPFYQNNKVESLHLAVQIFLFVHQNGQIIEAEVGGCIHPPVAVIG